MAVLSFRMDFPGQNNVVPRLGRLYSDDVLATVAGAGYLNPILSAQSISVTAADIIAVAASNGNEFYRPSVNAADGVVTLNLIS